MYFFTDEEREKLFRGILPHSRELVISDDLRGWNWHRAPLEKMYEQSLTLPEIAVQYCESGRDLFLSRVKEIKLDPSDKMIEEAMLCSTLTVLIQRAKRLIYVHGISELDYALQQISQVEETVLSELDKLTDKQLRSDIWNKIKLLWEFESQRICFRVRESLVKQLYSREDSLVARAIPIIVGYKVDGSFLGLPSYLGIDAINFTPPMVISIQFGEPRSFHRLFLTGSALAMEVFTSVPMNLGCIVYPDFFNGRLRYNKEFYIIDDELRQWFIEERDRKMRMVYEEIDPDKAVNCYEGCPYKENC